MSTTPTLDFDRLLAPIAGENPAGADMRGNDSHESPYWRIKSARDESGLIERKNLESPDDPTYSRSKCRWAEVVADSQAVLAEQSKDYEIVAWLCEGLLREQGFAGLRDGLRLARELALRFWDSLLPQPKEGNYSARLSQLRGVLGKTLILPIQRVPITQPTQYTSLDHEQAKGLDKLDAKERQALLDRGDPSLAKIQKDAADSSTEYYRTLVDDLREAISELDQLAALLKDKAGKDEYGDDLMPAPRDVTKALQDVLATVTALAGPRLAPPAAEKPADASPQPQGAAAESQAMTRAIAFAKLLELADFFRKTEPHSPISHHLEEVVRWGELPLPDLLAELIPEEKTRKEVFTRIGIRPPEKK